MCIKFTTLRMQFSEMLIHRSGDFIEFSVIFDFRSGDFIEFSVIFDLNSFGEVK